MDSNAREFQRLLSGNGEEVTLSTQSALREQQAHLAEARRTEDMELLGQQRSIVVHELSNSLAIIVLQSRLLASNGVPSRQYEESLSVIQDQAQRMMRMVESLRFDEDPLRPRFETVDVKVLLRQAIEIQTPHLFEYGIEVTTDLAGDLPATQADPYQLQQVFVNLINNARQAMVGGPKGGKLGVAAELVIHGDAPKIQIRFVDNGPGIAKEVEPNLFRPFFTTKKQDRGMGLGLSICDEIVQRHNGSIWAENNVEGGATFFLELPVLGPESERQISPPDRLRPGKSRKSAADFLPRGQPMWLSDDKPTLARRARHGLRE